MPGKPGLERYININPKKYNTGNQKFFRKILLKNGISRLTSRFGPFRMAIYSGFSNFSTQ